MVDTFEPTMNRPMAALVSASHCRRSCSSRPGARILPPNAGSIGLAGRNGFQSVAAVAPLA
jgi:hypothetical protein